MSSKIYLLMLSCWLYNLSAIGQTAQSVLSQKPKDEIKFLPIPKLERILFIESDFKKFQKEYKKEYGSVLIDTLRKQQKELYVKHTFMLAEILAFENKQDTAIALIEYLGQSGMLDNYYASIAGSVVFYNLRNTPKWKVLSKHACDMLAQQSRSYSNPDLRVSLLLLEVADQSNMFYYSRDTVTQRLTTARLLDTVEAILQKYAYPKVADVGKDIVDAPALILVHAPLKMQLKYRDMIEKEGLSGNIPNGTAGILIDKIMVAQEGKQSYGSQYKVTGKTDRDRKIFFYPIEDEARLEARRRAMGFSFSYDAYKSMINNQFKR